MLRLNIFDKEYVDKTPVSGVIVPSDTQYLRRLYMFNKDSIETYYLERSFSTKNTHILSRFLEHLPPFLNYDSYRYLEYFRGKVEYLGKHFNFTSDIEKGVVHPPYFFGNGGEEIIFSDYTNFDVAEVVRNWKLEPCLTVLNHSRNDTKLLLPLGNDNGCRGGLASIVIDLAKLALKYREFMREQYLSEINGGTVLNKNHFVMRHVLNTTVGDLVDHSFLNKVMDRFYGREEVTPKFKHRFKIFEPTTQIDRFVDQILDTITSKNIDFVNTLHNIPLMFKLDASELLLLPEFSGTRQSQWAFVVSRLEHMCFLYDVAKNKDGNKQHINDWKNVVKRLERDSVIKDQFSYTTSSVIQEQMYKIKNM